MLVLQLETVDVVGTDTHPQGFLHTPLMSHPSKAAPFSLYPMAPQPLVAQPRLASQPKLAANAVLAPGSSWTAISPASDTSIESLDQTLDLMDGLDVTSLDVPPTSIQYHDSSVLDTNVQQLLQTAFLGDQKLLADPPASLFSATGLAPISFAIQVGCTDSTRRCFRVLIGRCL